MNPNSEEEPREAGKVSSQKSKKEHASCQKPNLAKTNLASKTWADNVGGLN